MAQKETNKKGRPEEEDRDTACSIVVTLLKENDNEQLTCAASSQGTCLSGGSSDSFIQFVVDNVDHDFRTLEGLGTCHGMGIIGAATPNEKLSSLTRRDISVTALQISTFGQIIVHFFSPSKTDISLKRNRHSHKRFREKVTSRITGVYILYLQDWIDTICHLQSETWGWQLSSASPTCSRASVENDLATARHTVGQSVARAENLDLSVPKHVETANESAAYKLSLSPDCDH
ncbi:hypothetical protein PoB_000038000 [Plakobranchus ocellatus]|uniref:Late endosomal/lysosomal adaptor and MAPK and MTOR activator 5 n=1 Tax=Plakobranchus ocellatus TaxID=259542 RepID=A0AAV3XSI4_9GAST|nr:hypothetical protein PoB_000038000 [Plakobranchus ocellatus]